MTYRSREIFEASAKQDLHLAVAAFPKTMFQQSWDIDWDQEQVACLRSCLMKAEHLKWIEHIWQVLDRVT
jgi:hypothetical protein